MDFGEKHIFRLPGVMRVTVALSAALLPLRRQINRLWLHRKV